MKIRFIQALSGPKKTYNVGAEVESKGLFSDSEVARMLDSKIVEAVKVTSEKATLTRSGKK